MSKLQHLFGQIDIYLFDQLLRGNITPGMRVLDAGCGGGRNFIYFLREGYEVFGVDADSYAVECTRRLAAALLRTTFAPNGSKPCRSRMRFAGVVISSAVLHFARDDEQFQAMLRGTWRVLQPGGLLFCRLASSIGMERQVRRVAGRRFLLRMAPSAIW